MLQGDLLMGAGFAMASSLVLLLFLLLGGRKSRTEARLDELAGSEGAGPQQDPVAQLARRALPKVGAVLVPKDDEERSRLQARLVHAGLYSRQAMVLFLGVKVLLMVGPALLGLAAGV